MAIISKPSSDSYRENFEKIFGARQQPTASSNCFHRFVAHLAKYALLCVKCNLVVNLDGDTDKIKNAPVSGNEVLDDGIKM